MPTYEYRCANGHLFEVIQRMSEDSLTECITCEATVQRVFHPIAIHFKGSGFYNTDYGKAGAKKDKADSTSSESKSSDSGSDSTSSSSSKDSGDSSKSSSGDSAKSSDSGKSSDSSSSKDSSKTSSSSKD